MHAYGSLVVVFAIALAGPCQIHAVEGKKQELPACDPVATAKWVTSLYTLQKGKLAFDAGNANRLHGQISLAAKAKVSRGDDGHIIIDQKGYMPVSYCKSKGYETFFFKTPLTHLSPLSLGDFAPTTKISWYKRIPPCSASLEKSCIITSRVLPRRSPINIESRTSLAIPLTIMSGRWEAQPFFSKRTRETTPMV